MTVHGWSSTSLVRRGVCVCTCACIYVCVVCIHANSRSESTSHVSGWLTEREHHVQCTISRSTGSFNDMEWMADRLKKYMRGIQHRGNANCDFPRLWMQLSECFLILLNTNTNFHITCWNIMLSSCLGHTRLSMNPGGDKAKSGMTDMQEEIG